MKLFNAVDKLIFRTMKFLFYLIVNIHSIIIVSGVHYYGFRQICHQIAHHSFHLHDQGDVQTHITDCKLVNIKINDHNSSHKNILDLKILSDNKEIESLRLHKTDGLLANGNTPVYLSSVIPPINYTNFESEYFFNASTINKLVPELGNFSMYHDRNKTASMIVSRRSNNYHVDGNVGNYILRKLPPIQYLSTKYAYMRIKNNKQEEIWNNYVNNTNLSYDLQAPELNNVTVNLLVVLDSSSVSKPRVEVLRTLLMYFNYIDMFHGNFTSPKIHFAIKGVVLPPTADFIPYLGNNRASTINLDSTHLYKAIRTMYRVHQKFFDISSHDIIAVMTQRKICEQLIRINDDDDDDYDDDDDNCYILDVYSNYICEKRKGPRLIAAFHSDFQDYHGIFLDGLLSILGHAEETDESEKNCTGIGSEEILNDELKYPLAWSACNIQRYSNQFRKFGCSYGKKNKSILNNEPRKKEKQYNSSMILNEVVELFLSSALNFMKNVLNKTDVSQP